MDMLWVQGQKVLVEPYIEDFVKFNSNTGTRGTLDSVYTSHDIHTLVSRFYIHMCIMLHRDLASYVQRRTSINLPQYHLMDGDLPYK